MLNCLCQKYDQEVILVSAASLCTNCSHLKANHVYEGMMVNHCFYPHVNQGLKVESVITPLSTTCLERPEYNYQKVRSKMNEDFVHKVNDNCIESNDDLKHKITANRVDLFRGFKTIGSGNTSSSSRRSVVPPPTPTEFKDVLFFDRLK